MLKKTEVYYCGKCGKPLQGDDVFCTYCGTKKLQVGEVLYTKKEIRILLIKLFYVCITTLLVFGGILFFLKMFNYF